MEKTFVYKVRRDLFDGGPKTNFIFGIGGPVKGNVHCITTPDFGRQNINISTHHLSKGDIVIIGPLSKLIENDKMLEQAIDDVILKNEFPTIEEIVEMYQDGIKSNDINGLRSNEILDKYTVEELTTNLTKALLQNEYLLQLVTTIYSKKQEVVNVVSEEENNYSDELMKKLMMAEMEKLQKNKKTFGGATTLSSGYKTMSFGSIQQFKDEVIQDEGIHSPNVDVYTRRNPKQRSVNNAPQRVEGVTIASATQAMPEEGESVSIVQNDSDRYTWKLSDGGVGYLQSEEQADLA